jgi:PTH1 family peptidyl-tRNA hydrolase
MRRYRITRERLIVIYDELDLPLGKIRIRQGGSSAGHRGIVSIIDATGGRDFTRIRVGIGRPEDSQDRDAEVIGHVLGNLTPEEEKNLEEVIPRVSEIISSILTEGLETTMNRFN